MKENQKSLIYEIAFALILALTSYWQISIRKPNNIENGYRSAFIGCFLLGVFLLAIIITLKSLHIEQWVAYKGISRFSILYSIAILIFIVVNFFFFGGLSGSFDAMGYKAANILLIFLSLLPIPVLISAGISVGYAKNGSVSFRKATRIIWVVLFIGFICLAVFGLTFRTLSYPASSYGTM